MSKASREHSHLGYGAGGHLVRHRTDSLRRACHGTDRKTINQAGCLCYDDAESRLRDLIRDVVVLREAAK